METRKDRLNNNMLHDFHISIWRHIWVQAAPTESHEAAATVGGADFLEGPPILWIFSTPMSSTKLTMLRVNLFDFLNQSDA